MWSQFLTASKFCGSGLKIDLVVVVVNLVVKFVRFRQGLKRNNTSNPMEKYFKVYEN